MIKANELRIGNWIYNPLQQIPFRVDFTALSNVYYDNKLDKPRYEPIPLTEEILLKCGFEKKFPFYVKGNIEVRIMGNSMPCWVSSRFVTTKDQHLHQLQNLYFALTGEELNIEL